MKVKVLEIPLYPNYDVGYYGIPGREARGRVHLRINGKIACGTHQHPQAEFQWCAPTFYIPYIDCQKCLKIALEIQQKIHEESIKTLRGKLWR